MNKDNWDSDNGATQCDMEAEMRARKAEDLHKWSDEDLEYEICSLLADYWEWMPKGLTPKLTPYVLEWKIRHPNVEQYDENGNYKGN